MAAGRPPLGERDTNIQGSEDSEPKPRKPSSHSHTDNSPAPSKKRKSDASECQNEDDVPEIADDDPRLKEIYMTPQQVRRKVRDFLEGGNMKVGQFQDAIDVRHEAYGRFMRMNGTYKGEACTMYHHALNFFRKRQLQGLKSHTPSRSKKTKTDGAKADEVLRVEGITLDGEDDLSVPVFETCDEVRKKIRTLLRLKTTAVSQAALCRAINAHCIPGRELSSRQMSAFLGKKGPMAGNTSLAFYGAYVFFEKKRLKDGKPKSEFRKEMEDRHKQGGVNVNTEENRFILRKGDVAYHDKCGIGHIQTRGRM